MNILSKDILPLKTSQKFSSVLEPYAVKVASTVLRRGCHCEVMFLSDIIKTQKIFLSKVFKYFWKHCSNTPLYAIHDFYPYYNEGGITSYLELSKKIIKTNKT